jgi:Domain of unknown function (DUF4331)/FlgD Ig-like domain
MLRDRGADVTDVYAWVAPDAPDAVTLVGNWVPLLEPNSGPNFYDFDDNAWFLFKLDNDGDAQADIVYEFKFTTTRQTNGTFLYNTGPITSLTDPDFNVRQTYSVTRIVDGVATVLGTGLPVPPTNIGPASTPNYAALAQSAVRTLPDGSKVFAGPRDDPFYVDLGSVFDLLTIRKLPGDRGRGVDGVGGFNVMTIALQVPKTLLTRDGMAPATDNAILGVHCTTERQANRTLNSDGSVSASGPRMQVSRLGQPLVNEVVIALQDKDRFNASPLTGDGQFLNYVTNPEVAVLLNALFGIKVPPTPRNDLVAVFLTGVPGLNQPANVVASEQLRLNMSIAPARRPNRFGVIGGDVAGFPNGRRLADDVTDVALRVVAGVLVSGFNIAPNNRLGDGIDFNDRPFLASFPYVANPHQGFEHRHHPKQRGRLWDKFDQGEDEADALEYDEEEIVDMGTTEDGSLELAGPNPGPAAVLQYSLQNRARVQLRVFDLQGRLVRTMIDEDAAPGTFRATWDGRADDGATAGRGVYFARLVTDGKLVSTRKLVLE